MSVVFILISSFVLSQTSIISAAQFPMIMQEPLFAAADAGIHQRVNGVIPIIESLRDIGGTAGISVGVMVNGEVIKDFSVGFADQKKKKKEKEQPADSHTLYPLGSLTKAFVAATVAQLVHQGILEWEKPISSYVPELKIAADPTLADRLTLIDLLSHRTGLERLDAMWIGADNEVLLPKSATVAACNHLSPQYPLRSKWLYNNWMYALLGEIIERVTHTSWGAALEAEVLNKLGLNETTVIASKIPQDATARPYLVTDEMVRVQISDVTITDGILMSSAGGVRSNVHDMLIWANALMAGFRGEQSPIHLVEEILSGHIIMNKTSGFDELYALGFAKVTMPTQFGKMGFNPALLDVMPLIGTGYEPTSVFYHNGAMPGYNHCLMLIPSHQVAIVVLTNSVSHGDIADWSAQTILQAVLAIEPQVNLLPFAEAASRKWKTRYKTMVETLEKERIPDTPEPPHRILAGKYRHVAFDISLDVYEENDTLKFRINGKESQVHILQHYNHNTFCFLPSAEERIRRALFHYTAPSWLLHFQVSEKGEAASVKWNLGNKVSDGEIFLKVEGNPT
jgi:CubicO group peptidase (beta-lactamase class C family)